MRRFSSVLSCCLFAATASAQCATLTVSGTGAPGTTLTFAVDGTAATGFAFLLVGATQGSATVSVGPFGSVTLGVSMPFLPLPLGPTNARGDATLAVPVPSAAAMGLDLFAQGLAVGISLPTGLPTGGGLPSFGLTPCASNVVGFHFGT